MKTSKRANPERHIPSGKIVESWFHRNWTEVDALSEWIDNSLAEGAGNANHVRLHFDRTRVSCFDNGGGVSDLNLLAEAGESGSRESATDIGRYGIGGKYAQTYFGRKVLFQTRHDSRYHRYAVDWGRVAKTGDWPVVYSGAGRPLGETPQEIRRAAGCEMEYRQWVVGISRDIPRLFAARRQVLDIVCFI